MMQIKLPYPLTEDVMATLTVRLSVGKEMQRLAERNGYGPEELQNLIAQKLQEVAQATADALGIEYDPEPE